MPQVDVYDDTWIRSTPAAVARIVNDEANWRRWWPDLRPAVQERRGDQGTRWTVVGRDLTGSMEVWLEPAFDGVVLHYFLRLDGPTGARLSSRRRDRLVRRHARRAKQNFWPIKDRLEARR